jgi:ChrB-like protein
MLHSLKKEMFRQENRIMPTDHWLLFSPQLPATPSSLRVLVWRRMQTVGALNVPNGLWLLPHTAEHEQFLSKIRADIEQQEGMAWVFTAQLVDATSQERLVARFQEERQEEYAEFASRCQEFLQEIARETQAHKWTFAELEENEHDLHKLTRWLHQIQRRDFFPTAAAQEAVAHLARCTETLQTFAQAVYAQYGVLSSEETPFLPALQEKLDEIGGNA